MIVLEAIKALKNSGMKEIGLKIMTIEHQNMVTVNTDEAEEKLKGYWKEKILTLYFGTFSSCWIGSDPSKDDFFTKPELGVIVIK